MGDPRSKLQVKLVSFCSVLLKNDAIFCISYTISPFRIVSWVWSILVKRPYGDQTKTMLGDVIADMKSMRRVLIRVLQYE